MMITVAAMILLSMVVLNVNRGYLNNKAVILETKFNVLAVALATSIIEDATGLPFDENTANQNRVNNLTDLSVTVGSEGTEFYVNRDSTTFDDFDDYNGLNVTINDSTLRSAIFNIECTTGYVTDSNPGEFTNSRTWYKKLDVKISSLLMTDTVKISTVISYFYF